MTQLTPELLLQAYANGYFPMALDREDPELYWFSPEERGVIPLDRFHIPRGLKRALKARPYIVTVDQDFEGVIRGCAETPRGHEDGTWINASIIALYTALHQMGHAHSVEVWRTTPSSPLEGERQSASPQGAVRCVGGMGDGESVTPHDSASAFGLASSAPPQGGSWELIGGLYGVSIGGAFFGESMFSRAPDASKIALVRLVEILREAGYALLDTQYVNEHLKQFGVEGIPKADYRMKLEKALSASPNPSTRFSTASVRSGKASSSSDNVT